MRGPRGRAMPIGQPNRFFVQPSRRSRYCPWRRPALFSPAFPAAGCMMMKTELMTEDSELLRRYVRDGSDDAFRELVQRHLGFVYSVARRQVAGRADLAEEVTQTVFTDLAR